LLFFPTVDEDFQYFRSQGYSGSLNDMHYKAMGDLTHTGSLTDRIHKFLVSEYGSFYEAMRDLRNSSASFVALDYGVLTKQPAYSLDFINEYYRAAGVKSNLNPAVTHTRAGQATMTDGYGAEEVTNGTFDTDISGWTTDSAISTLSLSGNALLITRGSEPNNFYSSAYQTLTLIVGREYTFSLDIVSLTSLCYVAINGGAYQVSGTTTAGTYSFNYTPTVVSNKLQIFAYNTGQTVTVDNISVREAPVIKWAPHNLLIRSEELNLWSQAGTGSVVVDNAVAPDGTTTAATLTIGSTTALRYILSSGTYTAGDIITYSFWTRSDTVTTLPFGVNGGSNGANNVIFSDVTVTSTWQLVEFEFTVLGSDTSLYYIIGKQGDNPVNNQLGDIEIWHPHAYRSDLGGMVNNPETGDSYVPTTSSAVYAPRVGHHIYNGDAWVNEGVLHESEARTNLVVDSGNLTTWLNAGSGADIGSVTTGSPFGTYQTFSNSASPYQFDKTLTSGSTYVCWTLVKYSSGNGWFVINNYDTGGSKRAWFNVQNGVVGTKQSSVIDHGMVDYGDGWWLCWSSKASGSTSGGISFNVTNGDGLLTRDVGDTVLIAGTQLEAGSTPSSYIPTSGSTVTRAAETLTVPAANLPWPTPVEVTGTELVTNGTFDTDVSGWTPTGTGSLAWVSGELQLTSAAGYDQARQAMSGFTVGKTYRVTVSIGASSSNTYVQIVGVAAGSFLGSSARDVTFVFVASATTQTIALINTGAEAVLYDNISVKEINPLSVSIQMDGRMTYADDNDNNTALPWRWRLDSSNILYSTISTAGTRTGQPRFIQQQATSGYDAVFGANNVYSPNVNVPFNFAGRYGSTFINGAHEGTLLTANTTPTILPDLSSTNLELGYIFMGTIGKFRVWSDDLTDTGIATASAPSTEPSLQLTFDGSSTSSFKVLDWSE